MRKLKWREFNEVEELSFDVSKRCDTRVVVFSPWALASNPIPGGTLLSNEEGPQHESRSVANVALGLSTTVTFVLLIPLGVDRLFSYPPSQPLCLCHGHC